MSSDANASSRLDRTSAAILDAAAHVFAEQGDAANLASVADAAGISRATLYRYYANREALLDALAAEALTDITARLNDAGLKRASVNQAVERIVRAFVSIGDRYAVLLSDHDRVRAALPQLAAPVHAVLTRGVKTGVLRGDLPIEILNEFLSGAALTAGKLTQRGKLGAEEASAIATDLFLKGSQPRSRRD